VCPLAQIQQENSSPEKKIRCVLVHDHLLLRQGLRRLLEDEPQLEVVSEAGNADEALRHVLEHQPEVVIADAGTIGLAPQAAEQVILEKSPQSSVVFLSMDENAGARNEATTGQVDVVEPHCSVRSTSAEELVEMVQGACQSVELNAAEMPAVSAEWSSTKTSARKRVLTTREREVLKLLAEGKTVRSAASVLGLSNKTVDAHKFNLMRKLGLHNKAELVMWAVQQRVVKLPAEN
jgi:two-component system response regulator NreC